MHYGGHLLCARMLTAETGKRIGGWALARDFTVELEAIETECPGWS